MHYCCLLITKEFPTEEVIHDALAPFNEDDVLEQPEESRIYPAFTWDWWQVGGIYSGQFKLKVNENDEKYRWEYYDHTQGSGRDIAEWINIRTVSDARMC